MNLSKVKEILLKLHLFDISKRFLIYISIFKKQKRKKGNFKKAFMECMGNINNFEVPSLKYSKGIQIKKLFEKVDIEIPSEGFIFSIDEFKTLSFKDSLINNLSIDYSIILNNSLNDLKLKYKNKKSKFNNNQIDALESIEILINREINELKKSNHKEKDKYIKYLDNIKFKKVESFEEALQRILFFNQIIWQTGHNLNGFGRLDKVLLEVYNKDKSISRNDALNLIKDFLKVAHSHFHYKSGSLIGDTGQIIVIGGKEKDGSYFVNDLSYLFIDAVAELKLPDPKIVLRVSDNIPRDLMVKALDSISTGIGSPLLSNDEIIIDYLINFGYFDNDAYNYIVSACWEPASLRKGLELNNIDAFVFIKPLNEMLDNEDLQKIKSFNEFLEIYKSYLYNYTKLFLDNIMNIKWEEDPILSLFIEGCAEKEVDVSKGGAIYNNYGVTSVSLSNTINSLLNIKALVFDKKEINLVDLNNLRKDNFPSDDFVEKLRKNPLKFGTNNSYVVNLTNDVTGFVDDIFKNKKTPAGGKFKLGFSAPSYITQSFFVDASLDGRRAKDPFGVHISSDDMEYTELMHFASQLDYSGSRFNGNVVDFIVTPDFIKNNFDKFLDFIILSLQLGVFQMQLNVVDGNTLIKARDNPQDYKDLIVRVWGFSAYFNDLPIEYKDLLIERALKNESKSY